MICVDDVTRGWRWRCSDSKIRKKPTQLQVENSSLVLFIFYNSVFFSSPSYDSYIGRKSPRIGTQCVLYYLVYCCKNDCSEKRFFSPDALPTGLHWRVPILYAGTIAPKFLYYIIIRSMTCVSIIIYKHLIKREFEGLYVVERIAFSPA